MKIHSETHHTKDAGYQLGIRLTYSASAEKVWEYLFSNEGLQMWLGELESGKFAPDETFQTKDGVVGTVILFQPFRMQMTWEKKKWPNVSTLQIKLNPAGDKTIISFHHERLLDNRQRLIMKEYWEGVVDKIATRFAKCG